MVSECLSTVWGPLINEVTCFKIVSNIFFPFSLFLYFRIFLIIIFWACLLTSLSKSWMFSVNKKKHLFSLGAHISKQYSAELWETPVCMLDLQIKLICWYSSDQKKWGASVKKKKKKKVNLLNFYLKYVSIQQCAFRTVMVDVAFEWIRYVKRYRN